MAVNDGTDSLVVYTTYFFDLITAQKAPLQIQDVYYGDQLKIPRTPSVCVDSDNRNREINGAPRRVANVLSAFIIVYHSPVQDVQKTRKDVDLLGEQIEALVHADPQLGGIVIHSLVTQYQSGYATKLGTQYRSCRLTVQANSQTQLPQARFQ